MADHNGLQTYLAGEAANARLGLVGFDVIGSGDASLSGNWIGFLALDAVTVVTGTTSSGDNLDGASIPAGAMIWGPFTELDISAGNILAYRG